MVAVVPLPWFLKKNKSVLNNKLIFKYFIGLALLFLVACNKEGSKIDAVTPRAKKASFLIEGPIFTVDYNEMYEQPNWISYQVRDIVKVADRGSLDFYLVDSVYTSNDKDYYANPWDKGHLAPAAAFTDSYDNLYATFIYLNCALQRDSLNRGEWAALEGQARIWAKTRGTIDVRIDLLFDTDHQILETGAHVPSGFYKTFVFEDGTKRCFYFPNSPTQAGWEDYEVDCR